MSRNRLLLIAGALAVAATALLIFGIVLLQKNISSYVASHYQQYSRDANATRYVCTGSPAQVANTLAGYLALEARAARGSTPTRSSPTGTVLTRKSW
jgi:hypothetical protein